ncbi:Do family serine endopeptidase [Parapedobacter soli]|uniref:Do family serine endopeptidase n=1 Tax=Parapedobacter soli TaxID=416955 RepID=UPI0021C7182B|nr:Do family serine endopeptidase [Parapedobacter soli]
MRKLGLTLLTALVGGLIAVGGYKLFESKQESRMSFEERQQLHYASNPMPNVVSSTGNPDFTQAAAMVAPAVVHITTTYPGRSGSRGSGAPFDLFEEFFGIPRQQRQQPRSQPPAQATGSGVIISQDGYIVTNNHVVEGANKIEVQLTDKRVVEAKVIGRDPNTDLALVKINESGLPFVRFGDSDKVRIGEWVLAVGYPLGLESTVTAGIVSATGRSTGIIARELQQRQYQERGGYPQSDDEPILNTAVESFIQTDAVINKGNSGGPLVNADGELIGINSNIMTPTGTYAGYGFAVPVNLVKKISDDFIKFGRVKRGLIGITFRELGPAAAKELEIDDVNGLYIMDVVAKGAAEEAGLKKGDIITKLDGRTVTSSSDLQERIYRLRPGDKVKLTYKRDGKERDVTVTLKEDTSSSERDRDSDSSAKRSATEIYNKLGAGFVPADDAKKKELGISSGVVVTQVHRDGLFDYFNVQRGLVITQINGQSVNSADDVESALANSERGIIHIVGVPQRGSRVELRIPIDY